MYLNHFTGCGRVVAAPVIRNSGGSPYAKFSVALNKAVGKTMYLECIAWAERANFIMEHLVQGHEILVSGELDLHTYTDAHGGRQKSITLIVRDFSLGALPKGKETLPLEVSLKKPLAPGAPREEQET